MKNVLLLLLLLVGSSANFAQVGIGTSTPDTTAALDVSTTTGKGLLAPRMTVAQRTRINRPATGLLLFQTDSIAGFYYNAGTPTAPVWQTLQTTAPANGFNPAGAPQIISLGGQAAASITPYISSTPSYQFAGSANTSGAGTTTVLSLVRPQRITFGGIIGLGTSSTANVQQVVVDFGYQQNSIGTIQGMSGNHWVYSVVRPPSTTIPVSGSIVLPAGTYKVGMVVSNNSGSNGTTAIALERNDYLNSWIMISNP